MTRRRRAAGIEPPRQRCINLNMEEEYEEEEGTVEDTEKRRESRDLLTTAMRGVQFPRFFVSRRAGTVQSRDWVQFG